MPAQTARRWSLEYGCIGIAGIVVCYPQRSLAPASPLPAGAIPRSHGILPTAEVTGRSVGTFGEAVIGAVGVGEIVWLGFRPASTGLPSLIRVRVEDPEPLDALTGKPWADTSPDCLACPPGFALPGIQRGQVCEPFGCTEAGSTGVVQRLTIFAQAGTYRNHELSWRNAATVQLLFVRPTVFANLTGSIPEPLDPDAAYKGWRLP
jgi:hypothetical protein